MLEHPAGCRMGSVHNHLVGVFNHISQLGLLFPMHGKSKMFETTNQIYNH
jgi:hypothetical protein